MGPAESSKYHREILEMNPTFQPSDLANGRINPTKSTITYWHEQWRLLHLGARNGHGMIEKLKEKIEIYAKCNVTVAYKESPFAVAVITPIMKRAHNLKEFKETIFIDSTSSCDDKHQIAVLALGQEDPSLKFYQPFRLDACDLPSVDISLDRLTPTTSESCHATASLSSEDGVQMQRNFNKKRTPRKADKGIQRHS